MKDLLVIFFRVACSLLCAGIFYSAWMAVFITAAGLDSLGIKIALWLLAPLVTGAGFTMGIVAFERLIKKRKVEFLHIYPWTLTGCVIGAGIIFWFGPMLIVFGMFATGTVSVIIREVVIFMRNNSSSSARKR